MKKLILFSALALGTLPAFSQKKMEIPVTDEDTTILYKYTKRDIRDLKLDDITQSTDSLRMRIWSNKWVVELNVSSAGEKTGRLTLFVRKYSTSKKQAGAPVTTEFNITSDTAKFLLRKLFDQDVTNLRDDDKVYGYRSGVEGLNYIFEISTPKIYRYYTYYDPDAQTNKDIPELKKVIAMLDALEGKLMVNEKFTKFRNELRSGYYIFGQVVFKQK